MRFSSFTRSISVGPNLVHRMGDGEVKALQVKSNCSEWTGWTCVTSRVNHGGMHGRKPSWNVAVSLVIDVICFCCFKIFFGLSWDQPSELNYDKTHDNQSPNLTWINTRNLCCSCWVCHQIFSKFQILCIRNSERIRTCTLNPTCSHLPPSPRRWRFGLRCSICNRWRRSWRSLASNGCKWLDTLEHQRTSMKNKSAIKYSTHQKRI